MNCHVAVVQLKVVKTMADKSCCNSNNADASDKPVTLKIKVPSQFKQLIPSDSKGQGCCCNNENLVPEPIVKFDRNEKWIVGEIQITAGIVPRVSTELTNNDRFGAWKVRWGINRMNYKINPGIYAVGNPQKESPVLVTANYKLTFDVLRKELTGLDAWIMVLDTKGINVWCAAGKGTFGTKEILNRIKKTRLSDIVNHRILILPQLGAPGVSACEVTRNTGFKVVYGPVRASDIKEFIASGMKATPEMRKVRFNTYDRLVLTPIELVGTFKAAMIVFGVLFLLNLIVTKPFGIVDFYAFVGTLIAGCVLTPVLLPWIPGKAFAWKGWLLGFIWIVAVCIMNGWPLYPAFSWVRALGYLLLLPSVASFYAMNFTGASTYTSPSEVLKEMKLALPFIVSTIGIGGILILVDSFIKL